MGNTIAMRVWFKLCVALAIRVKFPRLLLISVLTAMGLVCGMVTRRICEVKPAAHPGPPTRTEHLPAPAAPPAEIRSRHTAESLIARSTGDLYGDLALWLLDAEEAEISAFWQDYHQRPNPDYAIIRLVFLHWTRLNPQAAIAAPGSDETQAWCAWPIHDPESALAAVSKHLSTVMGTIAEFHPKWLRAHFHEFSDAQKSAAITAMQVFADTSDPMAAMEFARKCGDEALAGTAFRALVEKDPVSAWDWIETNPVLCAKAFGGGESAMEYLIQSIDPSQMKDLERIAALTPPGALKRQMEAKRFKQLVITDPDAALAEAKATKAPRIAALRLAEVGKTMIHANPEKAFEVAEALISLGPAATAQTIQVRFPGGSEEARLDEGPPEIWHFMSGLGARDPARTLDLILPETSNPGESAMVSHLISTWAERDLVAYTGWVNQQSDPQVREPAARQVVSGLVKRRQYGEALDWVMSLNQPENCRPHAVYQEWRESNPQEARDWLESAKLPPDRKAMIEKGGAR